MQEGDTNIPEGLIIKYLHFFYVTMPLYNARVNCTLKKSVEPIAGKILCTICLFEVAMSNFWALTVGKWLFKVINIFKNDEMISNRIYCHFLLSVCFFA